MMTVSNIVYVICASATRFTEAEAVLVGTPAFRRVAIKFSLSTVATAKMVALKYALCRHCFAVGR